jgi:hypothetical protein
MKFTKNKGAFLAVVAIVLAVFNAIAFVIPFTRGGEFWTGYGFATLAILLTAGVALYSLGHEGMKSKFYGIPLTLLVWPYLIAQVIISLLEMAIPVVPYRYELLLNAILLAIVLVGLIGVNLGKEEVERLDAKVKGKVFYIKSLQGDVEGLLSRTKDAALLKDLKALAEAIRYGDPMSSPQLAAIENKIEAKVAALGDSVEADKDAAAALCAELQQLLAERSRKCKLLK